MFDWLHNNCHCEGCTCFATSDFEGRPDFDRDAAEDELAERELPMNNEPDLQSPPHTHEWGMWEIVNEGSITQNELGEDITIGTYLDQKRRCSTCGKYELDTQVTYI